MNGFMLRVSGLLAVLTMGCSQYGGALDAEGSIEGRGAALIGPDGDLDDFPPWVWPYIRTARIFTHGFSGQIDFAKAQAALKASSEQMACAAAAGGTLGSALAAIDVAFDAQYATVKLAYAAPSRKADPDPQPSFAASAPALSDDYEFCGTKIPPIPWPVRRGWSELVEIEADVVFEGLAGQLALQGRELAALRKHLDGQVERFAALDSSR